MYCDLDHAVNTDVFVIIIQLGAVTPTLIQANHTSGVGQIEAVNFTLIPTSMCLGCHVEVSQIQSSISEKGMLLL